MKKICMITTVSLTMKTFVLEIAKYLHNECGYDITLICNDDKEFVATIPEYIHFIPVAMARGIDLSAISSICSFIKIFKRQKFDLVQYATPNASCYASIAARLCRVPIRLYCQWGIRYVGFSGISRKIFKFIEKIVCNNSTHVRSVSRMNRAFAVSEGLYSEEKSCVVGNGGTIGVDMNEYDISKKEEWRSIVRKSFLLDEDDFVFGFAGRISADKGCGELLSSFKEISDANEKAKLLVVGPLEENCGVDTKLVTWAKESDKVIFTGKIDNKDMRMYYSAMDALVHPSYREGFGMVLQEAGALSLAIITTNIPGASEVMENGVSCILAEPKNAADLKDKMTELLSSPELARKIGLAAFERTKEFYSRPIMLENQREDYKQLIEG